MSDIKVALPEQPEAEIRLQVKADSGYESETTQRITVRQYADICRILNGEKLPAAQPSTQDAGIDLYGA